MRWLYLAPFITLMACPKPTTSATETFAPDRDRGVVEEMPRAAVAPAGNVQDGVYIDGSYPLAITLPEGWQAQPGDSDSSMRLQAFHLSSGVSVEVRVEHASDAPRTERRDCTWRFEDAGTHDTLRVSGTVEVATCAPNDPNYPRVFATRFTRSGLTYSFEVIVPAGRMLSSKAAVEDLLTGVRFH